MSGVEVVGLLLGAFPLCVSAMEHYEATRRVAGTFMKIRRAHRRDLGKIKDCQLLFKLNLKVLLLPLLQDVVIDKVEYELLLLHPGGPAWKNKHVELALKERLCECHDRYFEILQEMKDTMTELCESTKVDDIQFQQRLKTKKFAKGTMDDAQQAREEFLQKANHYVTFQAKRTQYAFTGSRRDTLLEDLEAQINKLQSLLAANDRVAAIAPTQKPKPTTALNNKALRFWRHANDIYSIIRTTWHCGCRSCLDLWLQNYNNPLTQMSLVIPFCHGRRSVNVRLSEAPPSLQLCAPRLKAAGKRPVRPHDSLQPMSIQAQATTVGSVTVTAGQQTSTVTYLSYAQSCSQEVQQGSQSQSPSELLKQKGLCNIFSCNTTITDCLGTVLEGDHEYEVYPCTKKTAQAQGTTLASLLAPASHNRLTRAQRYGIAMTLASSHLQLHSTPWLKEYWTSEDVLFPLSSTNAAILHGEPYIEAKIFPTTQPHVAQQPTRDRSFSTLGIVLLELCFDKRLEQHHLWLDPDYSNLEANPIMRQTVACEWLKAVQGEAGEDYANAVNWTLKEAPVELKDEKWREVFAQNVVQPLQRCHEYLHPPKIS
jgi:hypothetical protein